MSGTQRVETWVDEVAGLTQPAKVAWADGSKAEYDRLIDDMLRDGTLLPLNSRTYPNCYLHRSHPSDVARTQQLTFICTRTREVAGPTVPRETADKIFRAARKLGYDLRKLKIGKRMQYRKETLEEVLGKIVENEPWSRPEIVKYLKESLALVDRVHKRVFHDEFGAEGK